ncbi:MAG: hypothetical protein Q4B54_13110 [Coriobacteriales bacterium]|nr:hypothetical protein [Coriobacteriales bacterium]
MEFSDLTAEQKEKFSACETPQEILALAQEEGIDLTDEQMEQVAGGRRCINYIEKPLWDND